MSGLFFFTHRYNSIARRDIELLERDLGDSTLEDNIMEKYILDDTFICPTFFIGLQHVQQALPEMVEILRTVKEQANKECERDTLFALIDTITVVPPLTPEKLPFKQRVDYIADGEVTYTTPLENKVSWKRMGDTWVFWVLKLINKGNTKVEDLTA